MKISFAILVAVFLTISRSAQALQLTTGECSPIININFASAEDTRQFFEGDGVTIEARTARLRKLVDCSRFQTDDAQLKAALAASIVELASLKETFVIPALQQYLETGNRMKLEKAVHWADLTSVKIDEVVLNALELQARQLVSQANDRADSRAGLNSSLFATLDGKLDARLELNQQLRNALNTERVKDQVSQIISRYIEIVTSLKAIANSLAYSGH